MSWLTNSFKSQKDDVKCPPQSPQIGVKQDLSEITKTLTTQFRTITSFLSPPIPPTQSNDLDSISGARRDFAEIGVSLRSGINKVTNNFADLLRVGSDDEDYDPSDGDCDGAVGVTDEVIAFVSDIAMHSETWLHFPLPDIKDDDEEFDLSDAQQEHVLAVESLAPRLRALRIELCPSYISQGSFWKIYFVLLHPRLERHAAKHLSTPKILKARALLSHELENRSYSESMSDSKSTCLPLEASATETVKHPIKSDDNIQIVDKSVIQEDSHEGKDEDDWLKEESAEIVTNRVAIPIENHEDVSFSDLDDDDNDDDGNIPIYYKKAAYTSDSSTKDSRSWVQLDRSSTDSLGLVSLHNSETKESNDWLDVVDIDVS